MEFNYAEKHKFEG